MSHKCYFCKSSVRRYESRSRTELVIREVCTNHQCRRQRHEIRPFDVADDDDEDDRPTIPSMSHAKFKQAIADLFDMYGAYEKPVPTSTGNGERVSGNIIAAIAEEDRVFIPVTTTTTKINHLRVGEVVARLRANGGATELIAKIKAGSKGYVCPVCGLLTDDPYICMVENCEARILFYCPKCNP